MVSETVAIDGKGNELLSYVERAGSRIPIIFLHGSGFSKEVFSKQFAGQALEDHHLIAVDLPGHGESSDAADPNATYSYRGFAAAIGEFIKRKSLDRCIVVGWSLGGHAAFEMLDDMPQVAGVFAFGAPPAPTGPLGLIRSLHISTNLLLMSKAEYTQLDAERFELTCFGQHSNGEFVQKLLRTDEKMRPCLSRSVMAGVGISQRERVESTRVPICLLHGGLDPIVRTRYMLSIQGPSLFRGRTIVFNDAGHAPFADSQIEFDGLLKQFSDAVESGQAIGYRDVDPGYLMVG